MMVIKSQERLDGMARSGVFGSSVPIRKEVAVEPPPQGAKVDRTSAGLRDALFSAIEKVRDGEMMAEDAKAISGLASQICNTVQLEIQVAKLRTEYPADAKLIIPAPLALGTPDRESREKS